MSKKSKFRKNKWKQDQVIVDHDRILILPVTDKSGARIPIISIIEEKLEYTYPETPLRNTNGGRWLVDARRFETEQERLDREEEEKWAGYGG